MIDIYAEIKAERAAQDAQWGGQTHDDEHSGQEWLNLIASYWQLTQDHAHNVASPDEHGYRGRLLQVAALSVAALEAYDRHAASAGAEGASAGGSNG